jgi:hypothetical protein
MSWQLPLPVENARPLALASAREDPELAVVDLPAVPAY